MTTLPALKLHRRAHYRAIFSLLLAFGALNLLLLLLQPRPAQAIAPRFSQLLAGEITHTQTADFLAPCITQPELMTAPQLDRVSVSPVKGGEVRLAATLEDYFDAGVIDSTRWISGYSNSAFPNVAPPSVVDGVVRLDANYLRAQQVFGAEMPVRFFEASARYVTAPAPLAYADLGFYRSLPPLRAVTETSSIRVFVAQTTIEATLLRHLYVRSKDGLFVPGLPPTTGAIDTVVDNWGSNSAAQMAGLDQFRTFTILWNEAETRYLIDGSEIVTATVDASRPLPHAGVSTLPTYVFLYSQDPSFFGGGRSPLLVDWVRAGAYPASGSYTSCVQDAGAPVNWSRLTLASSIPDATALLVESRTSLDGVTWSTWRTAPTPASGIVTLALDNPVGRYFQYRLLFTTTTALQTPEVEAVTATYVGPQAVIVHPDLAFVAHGDQFIFRTDVLDLNGEVMHAHPFPVQWSVVGGGGVIDAAGVFVAGSVAGRFTDTVVATSPDLTPGRASVNVGTAPGVTINVCCEVREGAPVTLTAEVDPSAHSVSNHYAWDVDDDGVFGDLVGEVVVHSFPKTGDYRVKVLVTSSLGFTGTAQTEAAVANVPPQIVAITTTAPVSPHQLVTVEVLAVDVPAAILTYSFDWNDDGAFDVVEQAMNVAATHFAMPGDYTIGVRVRVRDDDGGASMAPVTVTVNPHTLYLPTIAR